MRSLVRLQRDPPSALFAASRESLRGIDIPLCTASFHRGQMQLWWELAVLRDFLAVTDEQVPSAAILHPAQAARSLSQPDESFALLRRQTEPAFSRSQ